MNALLRVIIVLGLCLPAFVASSSVAASSFPLVVAVSLVAAFPSLAAGSALPAFPVALEKRKCRFSWTHLVSCGDEPKHHGISDGLLENFKLYAGYAAAAYCPGNNDSPGTQVTCPCGNCPLVEASNATTISEFENTIKTDDTGYVAVDDVHKVIVLAFRGSRSVKNWAANFDMAMVWADLCSNCRVHQGFWRSWEEARPVVLPKVQEAVDKHPDYRLVVTGHSLGAAVATLGAANIRQLDSHLADITELYTFGSPRVGDEGTAQFLTQQSGKSYRITAEDDPIPRVPGIILGYKHMSPEYWIKKHADNPSTEDFDVLTGFYNQDGNSGTHWFDGDAHRHYLGYITQCSSDHDDRRRDALETPYNTGNVALPLLAPHVNASMLDVQGWQSSLEHGSITFPPGSVTDVASEAIHGPNADEDAHTTVVFGGHGLDGSLPEALPMLGDADPSARQAADKRSLGEKVKHKIPWGDNSVWKEELLVWPGRGEP